MKGFFDSQELSVVSTPRESHSPLCGRCGLLNHCLSPKMPTAGKGRKGILIVGEAPGRSEDEQNKPFVGKAGKRLQRELTKVGIDLFNDCWIRNSLSCRPEGNRKPTLKEITYCRPLLRQGLEELKPELIIPLGESAVRSVLTGIWAEDIGPMGRWVGWTIPCQKLNAWICPNWHPSYLERSNGDPLLDLLFHKYLKRAVNKQGRPWDELPDYKSQIVVEMSPSEAAHKLDHFKEGLYRGSIKSVAFDFETDRIKPDRDDATIICCSVSDGVTSIAFPWHGEAIEWMKGLLKSDVPKLGWSIKFEDRWIRRKLDIKVNNWKFDGMLAAHALDSRGKISGLHFQAFVNLGVGNWDAGVKGYMKADKSGDNEPNRLKEMDLPTLLHYCGMDSLMEWQVNDILMKKVGIET